MKATNCGKGRRNVGGRKRNGNCAVLVLPSKSLLGRYVKENDKGRDMRTWDWLRQSGLKKETEGMIVAAQEQALRTRYIRKVIDKEAVNEKCRMSEERDETVAHI